MTTRPESDPPDWAIPAALVGVGVVVVLVALIAFFSVVSTGNDDDRLAGQLERWTSCLRSSGAPVPLVEAIGGEGFRITVDDVVLSASFDHDSLTVAFDQCTDEAPDAVQRIAAVFDGLSRLPFGAGDLEWLGPLLFDVGGSEMFGSPDTGSSPYGDSLLAELCVQLSDIEDVVPEVARELLKMCGSMPDV